MSRVVVITGATRGIGRSVAQEFASQGASLIVTGRSERTEAVAFEGAGSTEFRAVDFGDRDATQKFCDYIGSLDHVDVLVNNAGINIIKPIGEVANEEFDRLGDVNYRAPYMLSRAAAAVMKRSGGGRIVNVASIWSVVSRAQRSLYSGSKTALIGMTRALAVELAPDGILVNAVSPGFVMTDLTRQSLDTDAAAELAATVPLGRFAEPDEIASAVAFLASPTNTFVTGHNLVVDGGYTVV